MTARLLIASLLLTTSSFLLSSPVFAGNEQCSVQYGSKAGATCSCPTNQTAICTNSLYPCECLNPDNSKISANPDFPAANSDSSNPGANPLPTETLKNPSPSPAPNGQQASSTTSSKSCQDKTVSDMRDELAAQDPRWSSPSRSDSQVREEYLKICVDKNKTVPSSSEISRTWNAGKQSSFTLDVLPLASLCKLVGPFTPDCTGIEVDPKTGTTKTVVLRPGESFGALGGVTQVMTAMYLSPPTSTVQYLASVGQDFGFIKPAYAQVAGSGNGIINPVRAIWLIIRNFTYLLFTVVFLVVGFMIMFRQKINQNVVVSAQAAIPGLVVGLILVTFSYFISALIVDLSFVGIQVVTEIFVNVKDQNNNTLNAFGNSQELRNLASNSNIFQMFTNSFRLGGNISDLNNGIGNLLSSSTEQLKVGPLPITSILVGIVAGIIGFFIFPPAGIVATLGVAGAAAGIGGLDAFSGVGTTAITAVASFIIPLILIVALLIQMIKLALKLVTSYISILIFTVISPLIILYSSLPGRGGELPYWWRTLLAYSLVFPASIVPFLFAGMILATPADSWSASPPLFANLDAKILKIIIAYGLVLGSPAVPDMITKALKVPDLGAITQTAAAGFAAGFGVSSGAATGGFNKMFGGDLKMREAYSKARPYANIGDAESLKTMRAIDEMGRRRRTGGIPGFFAGIGDKIRRSSWQPEDYKPPEDLSSTPTVEARTPPTRPRDLYNP